MPGSPLATAAAEVRRLAFHASPGAAAAAARRLIRKAPVGDGQAEILWLLGVSLGAAGRYRDALVALETVPEGSTWRSRCLSTSASLHRQVERHSEAGVLDEQALRLARSDDDRCDALLGLAADAVGLGDVALARSRWLESSSALGAEWRPRVRWGWVATEIALLDGNVDQARAAARDSVRLSVQAGAPRHHAKSLLFSGVAELMAGHHGAARHELAIASALSDDIGAWPLVWPAAVVGASIAVPARAPFLLQRALLLQRARVVVTTMAGVMPRRWSETWLAARMRQINALA